MSGHTPGPWEVAYHDFNGQAVVKAEHIEVCTCWHHSVGSIVKEMEANARLIAAAPDMLAALYEAEGELHEVPPRDEDQQRALAAVRAAIAKAEDRS